MYLQAKHDTEGRLPTKGVIARLEYIVESGTRGLGQLAWRPEFEPIRGDARWREFWDEHWYTQEDFAAFELNIH